METIEQERPGRTKKLALLWVLYFVQGLPFGFQANALPTYLRLRGLSLTKIGFLGALSVPWMLKALWAPLVDRYTSKRFGRRRSWIAPTQLGLAVCCGIAAMVPLPDGLTWLLALVLLMNLFAATMDIAVDGLAVDLLEPHELGAGNSAQVVGYKAGMLTGGGLLVWASGAMGWSGLLGSMGALVVIALIVTLSFHEPPARVVVHEERSTKDILRLLKDALTVPGAPAFLALVATYKLGEGVLLAMFRPYLTDVGFTPSQVGLWVGTYGMVASIAGSLTGGFLAGRIAVPRALMLTAATRVIPLLAITLVAAGPVPSSFTVISLDAIEHFFGGALTTVMFAAMMARTDARVGATHYTVLATIEVLGKSAAGPIAGIVAQRFGYAACFGLGTALALGFVLLATTASKKPDLSV